MGFFVNLFSRWGDFRKVKLLTEIGILDMVMKRWTLVAHQLGIMALILVVAACSGLEGIAA